MLDTIKRWFNEKDQKYDNASSLTEALKTRPHVSLDKITEKTRLIIDGEVWAITDMNKKNGSALAEREVNGKMERLRFNPADTFYIGDGIHGLTGRVNKPEAKEDALTALPAIAK